MLRTNNSYIENMLFKRNTFEDNPMLHKIDFISRSGLRSIPSCHSPGT